VHLAAGGLPVKAFVEVRLAVGAYDEIDLHRLEVGLESEGAHRAEAEEQDAGKR
jgi:hypothetical protein